jgi:N-acetylmuramic acid 6-phosphate etherase
MLDRLPTEQPNPAAEGIDNLSTEDILKTINREDETVARAVARVIPGISRAVDLIVERMDAGGRLFYIGAGTSGRLGVLDAAECPPTFQVSPDLIRGIIAGGESALARASETSEDDPAAGARDIAENGFSGRDVLVGIAASGRTPYVLGAMAAAAEAGAVTVGLSCNPGSELAEMADVGIVPETGPEVIAGSTRMKAGTATKLVLNMLSTAVMIRRGYVFGNLMVNVRPVNSKLEDRARRIVAEAGRVSGERARRLLTEAGGDVRTAILMALFGADREEAERRLSDAGYRLSTAIEQWTDS